MAAFFPQRSRSLLDRVLRWLQDHDRPIVIVVGLVFGIWFGISPARLRDAAGPVSQAGVAACGKRRLIQDLLRYPASARCGDRRVRTHLGSAGRPSDPRVVRGREIRHLHPLALLLGARPGAARGRHSGADRPEGTRVLAEAQPLCRVVLEHDPDPGQPLAAASPRDLRARLLLRRLQADVQRGCYPTRCCPSPISPGPSPTFVSKNGNLLLGIGPYPDGTIPEPQARLLDAFGAWLGVTGQAYFDTRPWKRGK